MTVKRQIKWENYCSCENSEKKFQFVRHSGNAVWCGLETAVDCLDWFWLRYYQTVKVERMKMQQIAVFDAWLKISKIIKKCGTIFEIFCFRSHSFVFRRFCVLSWFLYKLLVCNFRTQATLKPLQLYLSIPIPGFQVPSFVDFETRHRRCAVQFFNF